MAYMSQETKKAITEVLKSIWLKYGITKVSITLKDACELNINIMESNIDFIEHYKNIYDDLPDTLQAKYGLKGDFSFDIEGGNLFYTDYPLSDCPSNDFIKGLHNDIKSVVEVVGNYHNNSDSQIDYFDYAFYYNIKVGKWDKAYEQVNK